MQWWENYCSCTYWEFVVTFILQYNHSSIFEYHHPMKEWSRLLEAAISWSLMNLSTLLMDKIGFRCHLEKRKEYQFSKKLEPTYKWKEGKPAEISCEVNESLQPVVWRYNGEEINVSLCSLLFYNCLYAESFWRLLRVCWEFGTSAESLGRLLRDDNVYYITDQGQRLWLYGTPARYTLRTQGRCCWLAYGRRILVWSL